MRGREVLRRVELPMAMPVVMAGVRTAAVAVVATATLAAITGFGGLGRYVWDGIKEQDDVKLFAGALLVGAARDRRRARARRRRSGSSSRPACAGAAGCAGPRVEAASPDRRRPGSRSRGRERVRERWGTGTGDGNRREDGMRQGIRQAAVAIGACRARCGRGDRGAHRGDGDGRGSRVDRRRLQGHRGEPSGRAGLRPGPRRQGQRRVRTRTTSGAPRSSTPCWRTATSTCTPSTRTRSSRPLGGSGSADIKQVMKSIRARTPGRHRRHDPAPSNDVNAFVVHEKTAKKYKLKTVSDLEEGRAEAEVRRSGGVRDA